ncbi:MAG: hypothetical protein ABSE62_17055 [Chthoniobacteraceae bacterium]|jgi:uncharacterized metal-binding protein YceD (DUF177 family)
MKVHQHQIPLEGLHLQGEDPVAILQLDDPSVRPLTPIRWAVDIGLSDGGLFATGKLAIDLSLQCGSCLKRFTFPLRIDDFATQLQLTGPETVDLTDQMREDILLALPPYPHCDWNGKTVCKGATRDSRDSTQSPGKSPDTWAELDKLKLKSK